MNIDLSSLTIVKAHEAFKKGDFTATDLAKAYLAEIEKKNGELNAYLEVYDNVLDQAKMADKQIKEAKSKKQDFPMLMGIPLAIKDNILVKGKKASAASKILENYTATYDATVIKKLQQEHGAVLIGRTNMDEFAMGGSTENSAFGVTKNPHDASRVAGGSSGGSAAALAANLCAGRARLRHRRLYPPAGEFLRGRRDEADLWRRFTLWSHGNGLVARSDRAFCENDRGCRDFVSGYCWT